MTNMILRVLSTLVLVVASTTISFSQNIVLTPDSGLNTDSPSCITIGVGENIQFDASGSCSGAVFVSADLGVTKTYLTAPYEFTFTSAGSYLVFCNAPDPSDVAIPAACIIVADVVPTVGEWGVITLEILLAIFLVLAYKTQNQKSLNIV